MQDIFKTNIYIIVRYLSIVRYLYCTSRSSRIHRCKKLPATNKWQLFTPPMGISTIVGKTRSPWEWFLHRTYKNADDQGMVHEIILPTLTPKTPKTYNYAENTRL